MEIVKSIILNVFNFLESEYHYTPVTKIKENDIFIENMEVEYVNEIKRRAVRISYMLGRVYDEIKYTFSASITRIPYVGNEDFFSLNSYLQSVDDVFSTTIIKDFSETEAKAILENLAESLKLYALDIIDGKIWLETFYPKRD